MKQTQKRVTRPASSAVARATKAALVVYPGVRQDTVGRYQIGQRGAEQVRVPYEPTLGEPTGYPFDLRAAGGHLWSSPGVAVRCMNGCGVCAKSKPRLIRERA